VMERVDDEVVVLERLGVDQPPVPVPVERARGEVVHPSQQILPGARTPPRAVHGLALDVGFGFVGVARFGAGARSRRLARGVLVHVPVPVPGAVHGRVVVRVLVQVAEVLREHPVRGPSRAFVRDVPLQHGARGDVAGDAVGSVERALDKVPRLPHQRRGDDGVQVRLLVLLERGDHDGHDVLHRERAAGQGDGGKDQREGRPGEDHLELVQPRLEHRVVRRGEVVHVLDEIERVQVDAAHRLHEHPRVRHRAHARLVQHLREHGLVQLDARELEVLHHVQLALQKLHRAQLQNLLARRGGARPERRELRLQKLLRGVRQDALGREHRAPIRGERLGELLVRRPRADDDLRARGELRLAREPREPARVLERRRGVDENRHPAVNRDRRAEHREERAPRAVQAPGHVVREPAVRFERRRESAQRLRRGALRAPDAGERRQRHHLVPRRPVEVPVQPSALPRAPLEQARHPGAGPPRDDDHARPPELDAPHDRVFLLGPAEVEGQRALQRELGLALVPRVQVERGPRRELAIDAAPHVLEHVLDEILQVGGVRGDAGDEPAAARVRGGRVVRGVRAHGDVGVRVERGQERPDALALVRGIRRRVKLGKVLGRHARREVGVADVREDVLLGVPRRALQRRGEVTRVGRRPRLRRLERRARVLPGATRLALLRRKRERRRLSAFLLFRRRRPLRRVRPVRRRGGEGERGFRSRRPAEEGAEEGPGRTPRGGRRRRAVAQTPPRPRAAAGVRPSRRLARPGVARPGAAGPSVPVRVRVLPPARPLPAGPVFLPRPRGFVGEV
jgi:hypothetical protein